LIIYEKYRIVCNNLPEQGVSNISGRNEANSIPPQKISLQITILAGEVGFELLNGENRVLVALVRLFYYKILFI